MREAIRCLAIQDLAHFISGGIRPVVKESSGARVASATNVVLWEGSRRVRTREPAAVQVDNDNDTAYAVTQFWRACVASVWESLCVCFSLGSNIRH